MLIKSSDNIYFNVSIKHNFVASTRTQNYEIVFQHRTAVCMPLEAVVWYTMYFNIRHDIAHMQSF